MMQWDHAGPLHSLSLSLADKHSSYTLKYASNSLWGAKSLNTLALAFCPYSHLLLPSCNIFTNAACNSIADPGRTKSPSSPSSIISGTAPQQVATIGAAASMASRMELGQPSCSDENAK